MQEKIVEVPTVNQVVVPEKTTVREVNVVQQVIEKIVERVIELPRVIEVEKIIEKMRQDGVNINDYYKNSGLFYQCPFCSRQFSEDERPNLRNCGHFVCNN